MARRGNVIPIARTILADMETPVSAYRKIARGRYSFLLESVEGGERVGRYSFIGCDPSFVLRFHEGQAHMRRFDALRGSATEEQSYTDPLDLIGDLLHGRTQVTTPGLPRFVGGLVGYIGYETVCAFERLPVAPTDDLQVPNGLLLGVGQPRGLRPRPTRHARDRAGRHRAGRRRRECCLPAGNRPDRDAH